MTNAPTRVGERYLCFVLIRDDQGYGGPYGQTRRWPIWECEVCGHRLQCTFEIFDGTERRYSPWALKRMADHHECGHAPCPKCGQLLLRRKDGTPRQHAHNRCPGKSPGDKIEREFVKHMTDREYA